MRQNVHVFPFSRRRLVDDGLNKVVLFVGLIIYISCEELRTFLINVTFTQNSFVYFAIFSPNFLAYLTNL